MTTRTWAARWVFPGTAGPIRDGQVVVDESGRIVSVGPRDRSARLDRDFGDAAIVPGFLPAHPHPPPGPIAGDDPAGGGVESEIDWLRRVVEARRNEPFGGGRRWAERNVGELVRSGTTAVGDISFAGQSWESVAGAPLWGTVFAEILGLTAFRGQQSLSIASGWLDDLSEARKSASAGEIAKTRPGISPHAPYSTDGWLYRDAANRGLPLATHLGELPEERPLLRSRSGPLVEYLESLGAWTPDWCPIGPDPVDYLDASPELGSADWVVAHGNIFGDEDFPRLLSTPGGRRVAVAYCPRTHARFYDSPHPYRAMVEAGVVACLGTDSLASSPTLSLLDEVRFLHRRDPDFSTAELLRMATIRGAWALRIDDRTGSLEPGKSADLAVIPVDPEFQAGDPHRCWLESDAAPVASAFQGRFSFGG